ncbi:MAG: methyltransferase domain-containing protein [Planctomycetota bacterium]
MTQSLEEIKKHYELEKRLASKLKNSDKASRSVLYKKAYNELFTEIPSLRAVVQKSDPEKWNKPSPQLRWLKRFLTPETVFMDVGSGNCKLSLEVSRQVKKVYAVEVSDEISSRNNCPANFNLIVSDASSLKVPDSSVNIIYSRHFIEHLHPEDARDNLKEVYRSLTPGGFYICITPNRIFGPHDVSRYFDDVATGLHLKEYSIAELSGLLKEIGFPDIKVYLKIMGIFMLMPLFPFRLLESLSGILPRFARIILGKLPVFNLVFNIRLVARKKALRGVPVPEADPPLAEKE